MLASLLYKPNIKEDYHRLKVAKVALSVLLLSASIPSLMANAQENGNPNNYDQYIKEAIEQEILLDKGASSTAKGMSTLSNKEFDKTLDNITESSSISQTTKQNIEKLENAEVILLDFDSDGELINATSSDKAISDQILKQEKSQLQNLHTELNHMKESLHNLT
ncbi:hypothetical protein D1872_93000 [compost metagenome]